MEFNIVSRRTEIAYKAEEADECAQHHEVRGCASTVNAAVVQLKFAFLSGETCPTGRPASAGSAEAGNSLCDRAEVSRGHSRFGSRSTSGAMGNELQRKLEMVSPNRRAKLAWAYNHAVSRTCVEADRWSNVLVAVCRKSVCRSRDDVMSESKRA